MIEENTTLLQNTPNLDANFIRLEQKISFIWNNIYLIITNLAIPIILKVVFLKQKKLLPK